MRFNYFHFPIYNDFLAFKNRPQNLDFDFYLGNYIFSLKLKSREVEKENHSAPKICFIYV
ncbi:hypothetical protein LCGC14_0827530 [marine sediment metagenome]|uniref:Uncharacterized protein n=1 Tax=marine sediment metagenome TaxID=412755 RepID=A0A0F9PGY1_9ZZZZ